MGFIWHFDCIDKKVSKCLINKWLIGSGEAYDTFEFNEKIRSGSFCGYV